MASKRSVAASKRVRPDGPLRFTAEVWRYPGNAAWHFVTLPSECAEEIRARTDGMRRGFGSVRVRVTIGGSTWDTSVFPDKATGSFVLPVKKAVRRSELLEDGDPAEVALALLDADPSGDALDG